ncbi:IS3 family transposase [Clostridium merdae]|uniref:IS3 family transposase n=1 Tax=Clostridium merdae TaxID=1958780 RepID=UPI003BFA6CED
METACNYGEVGYRMVEALLLNRGILTNHNRVERVWREEGLKLPKKQSVIPTMT